MAFHITPYGPKPCGRTVGICPYAQGDPHFEDAAEANSYFERKMEQSYSTLPPGESRISTAAHSTISSLGEKVTRLSDSAQLALAYGALSPRRQLASRKYAPSGRSATSERMRARFSSSLGRLGTLTEPALDGDLARSLHSQLSNPSKV